MPRLTLEETRELFHNVFDTAGLMEKMDAFSEANEELPEDEATTLPIEEIVSNPEFLATTHLSEEAISHIPEELDFDAAQKFEFVLRCVNAPANPRMLNATRLYDMLLCDPESEIDSEIRDLSGEEKDRLINIVPVTFWPNLVAHPQFDIQDLPLLCDNLFHNTKPLTKLFFIRNCLTKGILAIEHPQHQEIIDQIITSPQEIGHRFPRANATSAENSMETIHELAERMRVGRLEAAAETPQARRPQPPIAGRARSATISAGHSSREALERSPATEPKNPTEAKLGKGDEHSARKS